MRTPPPNLRSVPFPWRLHEMLDAAETEGFESIVSWLPDGRSFRVHDPVVFVDKVMKKFFNQNKYKSFQRQLNIWGFVRILDGPMKGGYIHEHLVQNQPEMCAMMKRQKIKGSAAVVTAVTAKSTPVYPTHVTTSANQQQTSTMTRSTSIVSASDASVSSDTSSLTTPFMEHQHHQQQVQPIVRTADHQQYPNQYQTQAQQHQPQPRVWNGEIVSPHDQISTAQFEGEMFFLLGQDQLSVAPPLLPLPPTTTAMTMFEDPSTGGNSYRSNRRLSLQLFAASQGEDTGMPGIDQLFADLEGGTDALEIFNRSIAA
jgi:hypothetical protein